jgi:hypothetical protein
VNHQLYPNSLSIGGDVCEITDQGTSAAHGNKIVLTLHNPHSQRESFDMDVKVVLYGRQAGRFMEKYGHLHEDDYPSVLITGRLAVERDGTLFVICHIYHIMQETDS